MIVSARSSRGLTDDQSRFLEVAFEEHLDIENVPLTEK